MPLSVLGPLVVIGIGGIVLILHLTGHSRRFRIDSEAIARREWLRHFPDEPATGVLLAADRSAALVTTEAGRGLVWAFGADTTAHNLTGARVRAERSGLRVILPDFAAPFVRLRLTEAERAQWSAALRGESA